MDKPFFSIIIPVYKMEKYLPTCLNSLIKQKFKNFEVIIVNDASGDEVNKICERYSGILNIGYVEHIKNKSVLQARINGFKNCSGKYILYVDPDDMVAPELLSKFYIAINKFNNSPDWLSCHTTVLTKNGEYKYWANYPSGIYDNSIILKDLINLKTCWNIWAKCFRYDVLEKIFLKLNIDEDLYINYAEDKLIIFTLLMSSGFCYSLDYDGYKYSVGHDSLTGKELNLEKFKKICRQWKIMEIKIQEQAIINNLPKKISEDIPNASKIQINPVLNDINVLRGIDYADFFNELYKVFDHAVIIDCLYENHRSHVKDLDFKLYDFQEVKKSKIKTIGLITEKMRGGGGERATSLLASNFAENGYKCIFLTIEEKNSEDYDYDASIERYYLPNTFKERYNKIIDIANKTNIDLMIVVDHYSLFFGTDMLACKDAGLFIVTQEHNSFFLPLYHPNSLYVDRLVYYNLPDFITCLSPQNEKLWNILGYKNVIYLPNLLTFSYENIENRPESNHELIFSARLCPEKGLNYAILMMNHLVKIFPDAVLNVLGRFESQPIENEAKQLISDLKLEKNIIFHGFVSNVKYYLNKSSIHIMCSAIEGAPMVLFEAKSSGIPSVIFTLPYVDCTNKEDGCISVPQKDVKAMCDEICKLWQDKNYYDDMCIKAHESIKNYSSKILISKWFDIFRHLEEKLVYKINNELSINDLFDATLKEMDRGIQFLLGEGLIDASRIEYVRWLEHWAKEQDDCIKSTEKRVDEQRAYILQLEERVNEQVECIHSTEKRVDEQRDYILELESKVNAQNEYLANLNISGYNFNSRYYRFCNYIYKAFYKPIKRMFKSK